MSAIKDVQKRYFHLVEQIAFASDAREADRLLEWAFEPGRSLLDKKPVSSEEAIRLHHEAVVQLGRTYPDMPLADVAGRLMRLLMKVLAACGTASHGLAFCKSEHDFAAVERNLLALVEISTDNLARHDRQARTLYVNANLERALNMPADEVIGKRPTEVVPGEIFASYEEAILKVVATGERVQIDQLVPTHDGSFQTHRITVTPERDVNGAIIGALASGRDITDILEYQQKVHTLACADALTSLPNCTMFHERIRHAMAEATQKGQALGLMLLDLDNFKLINDTFGHAAGNRLLHEVARRLEKSVRTADIVARFVGDEFAIVQSNVGDTRDLANMAQGILKTLAEPYLLDAHELLLSASIGIALYPADAADTDTLLKYADCAMYHAKNEGRNNIQFYTPELTARSNERMTFELALRKALSNGEFELHYQPQVELDSGRIVGVEALLRWNRSEGGMVTPDRFIPVAEETGLIVGIGEWVLIEACKAAVAWNRQRAVPLPVAVNLSARQIIKNDLLSSVRRILAETGARPEWLKLEITESLLLEDSDEVLSTLLCLEGMGFSISIDDFGTGYSALSYLNRFPVSQIKIDRSFVRDVPVDQNKSELVKALISIARALRLELVAEGVETLGQAIYLQAHGCRVAQGYLFGRPMPRASFEALLTSESVSTMLTERDLSRLSGSCLHWEMEGRTDCQGNGGGTG